MIVWTIEEVLLRNLISTMVPSKVQSFTESIRSGFTRLATIVASATTPLVVSIMDWWCVALIGITILFLMCFVCRKRHLVKPLEIDFDDDEALVNINNQNTSPQL